MSAFISGWESGLGLTTVSQFTAGTNSLAVPVTDILLGGGPHEVMTFVLKASTAAERGSILKYDGNALTGALVPVTDTPTSNILAGICLDEVPASNTTPTQVRVLVFGKVKANKVIFAAETSEANKAVYRNLLRAVGVFVTPTEANL